MPYCQIIASHCAPVCTYPYGINQTILDFCKLDATLFDELTQERNYLQTLYEKMSEKGIVED